MSIPSRTNSDAAITAAPIGGDPLELPATEALVLAYYRDQGGSELALGFGPPMSDLKLTRGEVREACRGLAAKGLLRFYRHLMTDDGIPAGAGYGCTVAGLDVVGLPCWEDVVCPSSSEAPAPDDHTGSEAPGCTNNDIGNPITEQYQGSIQPQKEEG